MKKIVFVVFSACILFNIFSCKHDIPENIEDANTNLPPAITTNPCDSDSVYFQIDVLPLLLSNCAFSGCHGNGTSRGGVELSNYANVISTADVKAGDPIGSDLFEVISETDLGKRMPPPPSSPLSTGQIGLIRKWIEQGAKNNSCNNCDTANVTFTKHISPIIQNYCQGCHSGSSPSGGILLSNFNEIKLRVQSGELLGTIKHINGFVPMPYNQAKLDPCLINQIEIWINEGALDN